MSKKKEQLPSSEWRELLKAADYDYPEEIENAGKRRVRRRARKAYRQEQREEYKRRLADERRREPITAGGAILVMVAILAIGAAATHWWPDRAGAPSTVGHAGETSGNRTLDEPGTQPPTTPAPQPPQPSPSAKADRSKPEKSAEGWARAYLTRNPPVDKKHTASVERAAPWMTDALAVNLKQFDDKAWGELVSNGGVSKVDKVTVGPADDDRVRKQADTETRVWRKTSVDITVKGYRTYTETRVYLTEIMLTSDGWRVGRVLGV
ncbi:hypothetical protein [Streptomyces hiroshimensis]|uniref:Uncharacterized protein n=1 Tax=Streptomyces hiroshimensis TaxID=66424 RepID=A0ABQ2Z5P5_9ACTN|nr:hypothetical protein [Streptomyces hiroshimensis]GGY05286.1 hypothetical protein GCM10010324_60070 [Streptomyces hiroshimensis]